MSSPHETSSSNETPLTLRDWVAMLAVALLTAAVMAGGTELLSRQLYRESGVALEECLVTNDRSTSARGVPNSICRSKTPEDPVPIEYKFNSCGHRSELPCGPKNPGVYRIVMLGSSVAMALHTQEKDSMAALLPKDLSKVTGRPVELYNEGMAYGFSHSTTLRFNDALAEKPDLLLWVLTPSDVILADLVIPSGGGPSAVGWDPTLTGGERAIRRVKFEMAGESPVAAVTSVFRRTRTAILLQHLLFRSESQYVSSFLMNDPFYLKVQPTAAWQKRLDQVDQDSANIASRARAAGVPLVAVFLPDHAQADLVSMGHWSPDLDPYLLDHQLRSIIESHGGTFLDILPDFRNFPDPGQGYLPVDGHPVAGAHKLFATLIAHALTSGVVPALRAATPSSMPDASRKQTP